MLRSFSLPALLLGLILLLAPAVPPSLQNTTAPSAKKSHHVEIRYAQTRGTLRRATIRVTPLRDGGEARWRSIQDIAVAYRTSKGPMTIRARRVRPSGTGAVAEFLMPAPERITGIMIRSRSGETHSYADEDPPADDDEEPPVDPPVDPPADEDPPEEDCTPSGPCSGIIDPWTCVCDDGLLDPWGDEVRGSQGMSFDI